MTGEWPDDDRGACWDVLALSDHDLRKAWRDVREEILEWWRQEKPGRRPPIWWQFESPEPRERVGGRSDVFVAGKLICGMETDWTTVEHIEMYNGRLRHVDGHYVTELAVPGGFHKVAVDPTDPPRYESEASFSIATDC
jgi:hypothetical protein